MKRIVCFSLGLMLVVGSASAQSLGDAARKHRAQKKSAAARVYTNDDLTASTDYNNGAASGLASAQPAEAVAKDSAAPTPEDKAKLLASWRARFDDQKKAIALLERELDVTQREYKQQIALYYADAGNRLRDERAWAEQSRKFDSDVAAKQKDLAAARQKLEDMKEEARKAGLPSSISD